MLVAPAAAFSKSGLLVCLVGFLRTSASTCIGNSVGEIVFESVVKLGWVRGFPKKINMDISQKIRTFAQSKTNPIMNPNF